jgi:predicted dehydrogenase
MGETLGYPVTVGIVGCGRVAQHYKKIIGSGKVTGCRIVGVCDIDIAKAIDMGNSFHAEVFQDFTTMIEAVNPALVIILTPSGMHYAHAKLALTMGCNVLVEKPMTMMPDEAWDLDRLAKDKNRLLSVGFQNRFNPAVKALRKSVLEGRFGNIITATVRLRWCREQSYYEDPWHGTWEMDGGVINQQAIHHVDALNWIFGPVHSVCAITANRVNRLEAEDTLVAILKFHNGALGTIEATTAARPRDFEASLSVVGEKGIVVIGGIALNKVETWEFVQPNDDDSRATEMYTVEVENGYGTSHLELLNRVINGVATRESSAPVTAADAAASTSLIHALYKSDETRGWVNMDDREISARLGRLG